MCQISKCNFVILCLTYIQISNAFFQRLTNRGEPCQLPDYPINGKWTILDSIGSSFGPGKFISSGSVLEIECDPDYYLNSYYLIRCKNGEWTEPVGQCLRTCPPVYNTRSMSVTCKLNNQDRNCNHSIHNTIAEFKCADFYEDFSLETDPSRICINGSWGRDLPKCQPKCGQTSLRDRTAIIQGSEARPGEYPWQVAIYRNHNQQLICGGSLINPRVILTAAHCLADESGDALSKELYTVAVGKHYRQFNDSRDQNDAQFSSVEKLFISNEYGGDIQNYVGDIGILISKKTFVLSDRVLPVCVDWIGRYRDKFQTFSENITGFVSGWGFTSEAQGPSNVLKTLEVPVVPHDKCRKIIHEEDQRLLTHDKLCAGYMQAGKGVCQGDSGGGLVVKYGKRFFVMGIVSTAPHGSSPIGGCDSQQYGVYTKICDYIQFILEKKELYKPADNSIVATQQRLMQWTPTPLKPKCTLPDDDLFKFQSVADENQVFLPGASVTSGQTLNISCVEGFGLAGEATTSCLNGKWSSEIKKCLKLCPPFWFNSYATASCFLQNGASVSCNNSLEGTTARFGCAGLSENRESHKNFTSLCRDGVWDRQLLPRCVPSCGRRIIEENSINSSRINLNEAHPWHAGLYQLPYYTHVCGGTLIKENVILTAAICITKNSNLKSDYRVAAGKLYKKYDDSRDAKTAQFSEVENMLVHPGFNGDEDDFEHDVGLVTTTNKFTLTTTVNPACVDWYLHYNDVARNPFNTFEKNYIAYIAGWDSGAISGELQQLEFPAKRVFFCLALNVFLDSGNYKLSTKLCLDGREICKYRGEGLVIKLDGKFYVLGVLGSGVLSNESCNTIIQINACMNFISRIK